MKRWIHSKTAVHGGWYVGEPSSYEYGKYLDEARKNLKEKYEPFDVTETYFNRNSVSSTGYRIKYHGTQWFADKTRDGVELYGPFSTADTIDSRADLYSSKKSIASFKNINSVMNYLFNHVEIDGESESAEYAEKKRKIAEYIAKRGAKVEKIYDGSDLVRYEAPDGDFYEFDLNEEEFELEDQLGGFAMWCLESGALPTPGH